MILQLGWLGDDAAALDSWVMMLQPWIAGWCCFRLGWLGGGEDAAAGMAGGERCCKPGLAGWWSCSPGCLDDDAALPGTGMGDDAAARDGWGMMHAAMAGDDAAAHCWVMMLQLRDWLLHDAAATTGIGMSHYHSWHSHWLQLIATITHCIATTTHCIATTTHCIATTGLIV